MPYATEHAARLTDPGKYKRFARKNDEGGPGVDFVYGITADGKAELQAIRFDASRYSAAEAKKWCSDHDHKPILFEAAAEATESRGMIEEMEVRGYQFDDMSFRAYPVSPSSWTDEDRSFDAVLATERPVLVRDMKLKKIVRECLRMDGLIMPPGNRLPLQDAHNRTSIRHTLGSTRNLRIEKRQFVGRNVISSAEPDVATKIKEGHITDNSIGYLVLGREIIEPGNTREIGGIVYRTDDNIPMQVSTKWIPKENSLTPIGTDEAAKARSSIWNIPLLLEKEEVIMLSDKEIKEAAEKAATEKAAKEAAETAAAEKAAKEAAEKAAAEKADETPSPGLSRRDALAEITPRGWDALLDAAVIDGLDTDQYRAKLREELARRQKPVGTPEPAAPQGEKDGLNKVTDEEFKRAF